MLFRIHLTRLKLVTHYYGAMKPDKTQQVQAQKWVGTQGECVCACGGVCASVCFFFQNLSCQGLSIISSHPSSHPTCVSCQTPSLLHPLKITGDLRQHAYWKQAACGGHNKFCWGRALSQSACFIHFKCRWFDRIRRWLQTESHVTQSAATLAALWGFDFTVIGVTALLTTC